MGLMVAITEWQNSVLIIIIYYCYDTKNEIWRKRTVLWDVDTLYIMALVHVKVQRKGQIDGSIGVCLMITTIEYIQVYSIRKVDI